MKLREIVNQNLVIAFDELESDAELVRDVQKQLNQWGLYPAESWIDGDYGTNSRAALTELINIKQLDNLTRNVIDKPLALVLLNPETDILLTTAQDKDRVFKIFLDSESGFNSSNLRIRDRKIESSPYKDAIAFYPNRLIQKPDNIQIISDGKTATRSNPERTVTFNEYPNRGVIPNIDNNGLNFLHSDIKEACVCLGSFVDGAIQARWLGKNALREVQFWSATKFIALLNIVSQLNSSQISSDIDNCVVKSSSQAGGISFHELAIDLVSYKNKHGSSNSIGLMFKRFESYAGLDRWTESITGNNSLTFQGRYGEDPFFPNPQLYDRQLDQTVLRSKAPGSRGPNLVSAYDLTRLITTLGWHYHLASSARLPGAQWYSLESVARAMGHDRARYVDFAIERLGLQKVIKDPVIISKVGWGPSNSRNRYEIVYTALIQFVDRRLVGNPSKLRTLALTLRSAKALSPRNINEEAKQLDARIATEVTEILRRVVTEEI